MSKLKEFDLKLVSQSCMTLENAAEYKKICLNWSHKRLPRTSTDDCGIYCCMPQCFIRQTQI